MRYYRNLGIIVVMIIIFLTQAVGAGETLPYTLEAQNIVFDYEHNILWAEGDVFFQWADINLKAEQISLAVDLNQVEAWGDKLILESNDQILKGSYLVYNYQEKVGSLYGAESKFNAYNFKGGSIEILSSTEDYWYEIKEASFTTCLLAEPHYQIKAQKVFIYPEEKIVAQKVEVWFGERKLFSLPSYVMEYTTNEAGETELVNTVPLPDFTYNSKEGLALEYYYPYQIQENWQGLLAAKLTQEGERDIYIDNKYQFNQNISLLSKYQYVQDIDEDDEISRSKLLESGLDLLFNKLHLYSGLAYDLLDKETSWSNIFSYQNEYYQLLTNINYNLSNQNREEKINLDIYSYPKYLLQLYQKYENEVLKQNSYSLSFQGEPVKWKIIQREGYDVDYNPYLTLTLPKYNYRGLEVNTSLGIGQVKEGEVSVAKTRLALNTSKRIDLGSNFSIDLGHELIANTYWEETLQHYQVNKYKLNIQYQGQVEENVFYQPSLYYELIRTEGNYLLDVDEVETGEYLKPGIVLKVENPEELAAWLIGLDGSFNLESGEWEKVNLDLTRQYDCYSYTLNLGLMEKSFGIGFNF